MGGTLFPHDVVRKEQDTLIAAVLETIDAGGQLAVHAPTGLGKTAATLAPAIERALATDRVVLFLTSRLTQHALALETVQRIQVRHGVRIPVVDLVGKKHCCLQPGIENLGGKEFADYCGALREDGACVHYTNMKQNEQLSPAARGALVQLGKSAPNTPEQVKAFCAQPEYSLCPYEVTMLLAKEARVIITDYSYIFNPRIRESFFKRINRSLQDCILIVDEGHNLPERVKELATERLTTSMLRRAIKELEKLNEEDHRHHLLQIGELLATAARSVHDERYVSRDEFLDGVRRICPVDELIEDLLDTAVRVREEQKSSSCGSVADFLGAWSGEDSGFTRILSVTKNSSERQEPLHPLLQASAPSGALVQLSYRCLDPAVITSLVFSSVQSAIVMSGTLTPTAMYAEVLGLQNPKLLTLASPFPDKNRLSIVIPKTTTKYVSRGAAMYQEISAVCAKIAAAVPGNIAIFFPSYQVLNEVKPLLETTVHRTLFTEHPSLTREDREEMLDRFRSYQHTGALLLGVMGGSFSEGIDLPGHELRTVVVVGLPLGRPDLETKALIEYYQEKFGKGWEYGYTFPAFNKTLQSAGRCIRTETDRGAIIFLDERYAWQNYYMCFPKDWNVTISLRYEEMLREFFVQQ